MFSHQAYIATIDVCVICSHSYILFQTSKMEPSSCGEYNPKEFICGAGAAFTNITITFPINKVMFRQQLHGLRTPKAVTQVYNEGVRNLYRGMLSPLLQKTTSMSIMFGMYDHYRLMLYRTTTWKKTHCDATAALMAGCIEALLCPFERIQVLMQDKKYHGHFRNTLHAAMELKSYGIREYYRGLSCVLIRNGPSNAAYFLLRKPIKELLPNYESPVSNILRDFVSGAVLGASISTVFYPLNVVKTRMQSRMGGDFVSMIDTYHTVFRERQYSWRKMFRGVHLNFTRSLLSWGIINASYEIFLSILTTDQEN